MGSDNEVLLARFIDHLVVERDLSPNSVDAYRRDLEKFRLFMERRSLDAAEVKRLDVEAFVGSMRSSGLSPRSTVRALSALRTFYRFLRTEGYCEADPAARVERPALWKKLPVVLDFFEIEDLLAAPDLSTDLGIRDRAMLELAYAAGLRVSELLAVRLQDIDSGEELIRVHGKGRKDRLVPVGAVALDYIERYRQAPRRRLLKDDTIIDAPFLNFRGEPLEPMEGLHQIARGFSFRMNRFGFFGHYDLAGNGVADRLREADIKYAAAAENIAKNINFSDPVATAVHDWMESAGHRANILNSVFSKTGVGIWKDGEVYHFTQVFMDPR